MEIEKLSVQGSIKTQKFAGKVSPKPGKSDSSIVHADSFKPAQEESEIGQFMGALSILPEKEEGLVDGKIIEAVTKQYADSYGRVKHLAMQLSSYVYGRTRTQVLDSYKTLFLNMEPDTKFTVIVGSDRDRADVEKVIRDNEVPNPDRINILKPDVGSLTVWARDMMVGMFLPDDESKQALLDQTMLHDWHNNDAKVPAYIADKYDSIVLDKEPRIVTDGGDTVSNRNESYVGYYSLAATAKNLHNMGKQNPRIKQRMIAYYENQYNREVVKSDADNPFPFQLVPRDYPREMHIMPFSLEKNPDYNPGNLKPGQADEGQMYEDLATELFSKQFGKPVNVMGRDDPTTPQTENPASDHMDMGMTPVDEKTFTLGSPDLTRRIFKSMTPDELKQAENVLSRAAGKKIDLKKILEETRANDSQHDFDVYEKKFKDDGYRVIRLPHAEPGWGSPYISYNNCLMERWDKKGDGTEYRRIFLPTYGIEKLDKYAIEVYQKEGFEVIPMRLDSLSSRWGALRCITNWLERSPQG